MMTTPIVMNATTTIASNITTSYAPATTSYLPIPNMLPVIGVLYVCVVANILSHFTSLVMGFWCTKNFKHGLKEKVFNTGIDKWIQQRWSSK